jgi:hypothetical protein
MNDNVIVLSYNINIQNVSLIPKIEPEKYVQDILHFYFSECIIHQSQLHSDEYWSIVTLLFFYKGMSSVKILIACSSVGGCRRFGETCRLHLQTWSVFAYK